MTDVGVWVDRASGTWGTVDDLIMFTIEDWEVDKLDAMNDDERWEFATEKEREAFTAAIELENPRR